MGNLSIIFLLSFFLYFALCQNASDEYFSMPAELKNIGQLLKILKSMEISSEGSNSVEIYNEFLLSPRKNCFIYEPTKVKTNVKLNSIQKFHQDTHELFLGIIIDYSWRDERLKISRNMRLPYDKVVSSTFWRPSFDFNDVTILTQTEDKFIFMDHQVNHLSPFILQSFQTYLDVTKSYSRIIQQPTCNIDYNTN